MSIKEQIEQKKNDIRKLNSDIDRVNSQIRHEEFKKNQANSGKTMGFVYMANPTMRP